MIILMTFSFNLAAYSTNYEKGLNYLRKVKKINSPPISEWEKKDYLEKAYRAFRQSNQKNARLFQVYIGRSISKNNEIRPAAARFVKEYRTRYITMIADLELLNNNEKNDLKTYMLEIEEQIPAIKYIKLSTYSIYPFQGERPTIEFSLNSQAAIKLDVDGNPEAARLFPGGIHNLSFAWRDRYMKSNKLKLKLYASNDLSYVLEEQEIFVDISLPDRLRYYNGEYLLEGEYFKRESKAVTRRNGSILLGGIILGALLGVVVYFTKENESTGEIYSLEERRRRSLITGGLTFGIGLVYYLASARQKIVPHQRNIHYNRKLKKQIEQIKKQIRINLKVKNEE